jgi:cation:H+ antiporter
VLIAALWVVGLVLISRAHRTLPWHESGEAPDNQAEPQGHSQRKTAQNATDNRASTTRSVTTFGVAALVTLVGGVVLERSDEAVANDIGLSGVLFGATVLAAATSLPETLHGAAVGPPGR